MPAEKAVIGERLVVMLRGIQEHFHDAIYMTGCGDQEYGFNTEAAAIEERTSVRLRTSLSISQELTSS